MEEDQKGTGPQGPPQAPPPPQQSSAPPPPTGSVSPNRTVMFILSYLWLLALVPLLTEKEDNEVQWHAKHGIVLMGAEIALWIALMVLNVIPVIGTVIGCALSLVLPIAILVVHILCIVKAVNGERFKLPFISDFADQWK